MFKCIRTVWLNVRLRYGSDSKEERTMELQTER